MLAMLLSLGLSAQTYPPKLITMHGKNTASTYTFTNTSADTLYIQSTAGYANASLHAVITGSVIGTAALQGSLDNSNFVAIGSSDLTLTGGGLDTKVWVVENSPYAYYRILATGSSTVTAVNGVAAGYFMGSKESGSSDVSKLMTYNAITTNTVTNTGTAYLGIKLTSWFTSVSFQVNCTKVSGTQGGTVTLQGSNDGINYLTVNTGYISNDVTAAPYTTGGSATHTATDVAVSKKIFVLRGSPYQYYRVSWTGTGTMKSTMKCYVYAH